MPPNPYRRQPNINDMMYPKGSKQPRQVWAAVLNVYKEPPSTTPPVTPSPTPTSVTPTPTPTNTNTPSITPTNTPSVSPTNTLTPTPSVSPTSTQTPTPTNTITPSITPTNTNTPSITPSSAFCPEQFSITDEGVTGLSPNGTYNKLYSYTGGSFNYGYFSSISPYTFVPGIAPDGNNYAVFGGVLSGGSYSCMVRSFVSGVDVSWSIVQTSGDYVFNGGANIGQDKDYFTGQTTSAGVVYPPQARTSISGQPKEFIYIAYSSVCPSPTPSITPTNTQTPSVSPTSTLTPTPSVSPTNTSTPTPTNTQTPTPTNVKVILSGGTVTDAGGFRTHTFTSNGTLTVIQGGPVQLLMVAGGGGGGAGRGDSGGGGGGGGGQIYTAYTISTGGAIVIGQGGAGGTFSSPGTQGDNTTGLGFTAIGGGAGGAPQAGAGGNGGNGGGAGCGSASFGLGTAGQGNNGSPAGTDPITGEYSAGAGGSSNNQAGYSIGGALTYCGPSNAGVNGAANTGNGGKGSKGSGTNGGSGGSGIVKITYAL